jgi:hypothetical protein
MHEVIINRLLTTLQTFESVRVKSRRLVSTHSFEKHVHAPNFKLPVCVAKRNYIKSCFQCTFHISLYKVIILGLSNISCEIRACAMGAENLYLRYKLVLMHDDIKDCMCHKINMHASGLDCRCRAERVQKRC